MERHNSLEIFTLRYQSIMSIFYKIWSDDVSEDRMNYIKNKSYTIGAKGPPLLGVKRPCAWAFNNTGFATWCLNRNL